jgi:hypothetical protein
MSFICYVHKTKFSSLFFNPNKAGVLEPQIGDGEKMFALADAIPFPADLEIKKQIMYKNTTGFIVFLQIFNFICNFTSSFSLFQIS